MYITFRLIARQSDRDESLCARGIPKVMNVLEGGAKAFRGAVRQFEGRSDLGRRNFHK